jgi:hypothetical protein
MRKRMRFGGPITQPVVVAISRSPYGADRSELHPLLSRINASVMWWIRKKDKRLRTVRKAAACWQRVTSQHPRLFAHWAHGSGQGCCPRDLRHVRPQRRPLPGGVAALEPHLGPIPRPTGHPDHRDTCRTLDTPTELSPESMPTNGRCSSRSTTHRCHTCCLRIHATAFRTLQDAEPRRSVIIRRET